MTTEIVSADAPAVSIVMPAFNAGRYIEQAIGSVLSQTWRDWELWVVDDGSTDRTVSLATGFAKADRRVQVISQANSGRPACARNAGLRRSRGRFVSFLDSDDTWAPERLSVMLSGMKAHPKWAVAFHDMNRTDACGNILPGSYLTDVAFMQAADAWIRPVGREWYELDNDFFQFMCVRYAAMHTNTVIFDTNKIPKADCYFDETLTICEDTDLWIRLAIARQVGYCSNTMAFYRQHPSSITQNSALFARSTIRFHTTNYLRVASMLSPANQVAYRLKIANAWRDHGYEAYVTRNRAAAMRAYWQAMRLAPRFADMVSIGKALLPRSRRSGIGAGS